MPHIDKQQDKTVWLQNGCGTHIYASKHLNSYVYKSVMHACMLYTICKDQSELIIKIQNLKAKSTTQGIPRCKILLIFSNQMRTGAFSVVWS